MLIKILKIAFFLSIILSCLLGFVFPNENPHFFWQKLPVFEALFGFIGCIVVVFVAKFLGRFLLQKKEDYYND